MSNSRIVDVLPVNPKLQETTSLVVQSLSSKINPDKRKVELEPRFIELCKENDLNPSSIANSRQVVLGGNGKRLDLSNPMDEIDYLILLNSSYVHPIEDQNQFTLFYIKDSVKEMEASLSKQETRALLNSYTVNWTIERKRKFLRLFGHNANTMKDLLVSSTFYDLIEKEPNRMMDYYKNPDLEYALFWEFLVEVGEVVKRGPLYYYNQVTIGADSGHGILWLKDGKNKETLSLLQERYEWTIEKVAQTKGK